MQQAIQGVRWVAHLAHQIAVLCNAVELSRVPSESALVAEGVCYVPDVYVIHLWVGGIELPSGEGLDPVASGNENLGFFGDHRSGTSLLSSMMDRCSCLGSNPTGR